MTTQNSSAGTLNNAASWIDKVRQRSLNKPPAPAPVWNHGTLNTKSLVMAANKSEVTEEYYAGPPPRYANSIAAGAPTIERWPVDKRLCTTDTSQYFFPLFYASERGPLGIWDKNSGTGHIKRRMELEGTQKYHVLEILNQSLCTNTWIAAPKKEWMALHIPLPHLVIVMKNFRRNFSFEVQVMDNRGWLRRIQMATWHNPMLLRRWPHLLQVPLKLEIGWNEIHVDMNEILYRAFHTKFFEVTRIQINANCRLRQVFFCADPIVNGDCPVPSMKIFDNMKFVPPVFGPFNHPTYTEPGPSIYRELQIQDPPTIPVPTRIERDMRHIHAERVNDLTRMNPNEPHRSRLKQLISKSKAILEDERLLEKINPPKPNPVQRQGQGQKPQSQNNNQNQEPPAYSISRLLHPFGPSPPPGSDGSPNSQLSLNQDVLPPQAKRVQSENKDNNNVSRQVVVYPSSLDQKIKEGILNMPK